MIALCVAARRAAEERCARNWALTRKSLRYGLTVALTGLLLSSGADAATVQASPADSFVQFTGLNVHLNWAGTIWQWQAPTLRQRIGELRIRYVRTAMARTSFARDYLKALNQEYGVRANVLVDYGTSTSLDTRPVQGLLNYLRDQVGAEKIASFEGPNEYSSTKYTWNNTDWAAELRLYQSYLYRAVKAMPEFRALPVLAPTIWQRLESDYKTLGDLSTTTDFGSLHYYTAGRKPSRYFRQSVYNGTSYDSPVDMAIQNAQITTPGTKIQVTETGYNIRTTLPKSKFYVSEKTSAKYTLRLISEFFIRRAQVARCYIFSLLDEDSTKRYGLLRGDLSRRPSFFAIKNAIALLSDPGSAFPLGTLTYYLAGDMTDVRTTLLQKRNGRYYLLIWLDAASYNQTTLTDVDSTRSLTLDLRARKFSQAKVYMPTGLGLSDPNRGVMPVQTINAPGLVSLGVKDQLMIVEMIP
jgi:hypothetical protein